MRTRQLTAADRPVLERGTFENVNRMGIRLTREDVRSKRQLNRYFAEWPGTRDFGLAVLDETEEVRGVAWLTFFDVADPGYGFVDEVTPELSLWVHSDHRGKGLGGELLLRSIEAAGARGLASISLSVETGNPARRLYERHGFRQAGSDFDEGTLVLHL